MADLLLIPSVDDGIYALATATHSDRVTTRHLIRREDLEHPTLDRHVRRGLAEALLQFFGR